MQSKKASIVETVISTVAGLVTSIIIQIIVYPLYGLEVSFSQNLQLTAIFTAVSIVRGYIIRRFFNKSCTSKLFDLPLQNK